MKVLWKILLIVSKAGKPCKLLPDAGIPPGVSSAQIVCSRASLFIVTSCSGDVRPSCGCACWVSKFQNYLFWQTTVCCLTLVPQVPQTDPRNERFL